MQLLLRLQLTLTISGDVISCILFFCFMFFSLFFILVFTNRCYNRLVSLLDSSLDCAGVSWDHCILLFSPLSELLISRNILEFVSIQFYFNFGEFS